jgi:F0F1-type ATP synthase assembly protein I
MFSFKYKMVVATKAALVLLSLAAAQLLSFLAAAHSFGTRQPCSGCAGFESTLNGWIHLFTFVLLAFRKTKETLQSVANSAPDTEKSTKQGTGSEFWGFNVVNRYL